MSNSNSKKTWTIDDMINLGEYTNFIRICVDENLTLKALADMYGVSPRTIGRWKERWSAEIEAYQNIRKIEDKFDYGETLTQEDRDFYEAYKYLSMRKLNLKDDDLDTEPLDIEDLDDEIGEYQDFFHHNLQAYESAITVDVDDAFEDTSNCSYTFTLTKNSLSIDQYSDEDGLVTNHCDKSNPIYQEFVSNVIQEELSEEQEQELLAEYWAAMKPAIGLETFTRGRIKVDMNSHQVIFIDDDGQEHVVVNRLTDKIVQTYLDNEPAEHLIAFLDNLMNNVSKRTIDNLYSFLAFNDIKITDDGCFTAWKVINYDYTDCYTGTIDNSPGQIVTIPRNQVDDDPEVTCSTGLHVCAAHYIPHFSRYNSRLVKVKVDPKDVVACPNDYKFAKLRTCRYEVLEEVVDFNNNTF